MRKRRKKPARERRILLMKKRQRHEATKKRQRKARLAARSLASPNRFLKGLSVDKLALFSTLLLQKRRKP